MTAAPRVRMHLLLPDAQALSSVLLDSSPAAAEQLCDQLWLRTVLVEQRRGTPRAERAGSTPKPIRSCSSSIPTWRARESRRSPRRHHWAVR